MPELPPHVAALARHQDGVVSRRQLVAAGVEPHEIRCWRRGRLLTPVHDGVYVLHSGPLTTRQREWAAVLWAAPAALYGPSALGPGIRQRRGGEEPVHVAVDAGRKVRATTGVTVHRVVDLAARAQLDRAPPRMRVEEAVLDAAAGCEDDWSACSLLAQVVSSRATTADRVAAALARRTRIRRRAFLADVLSDLAVGACSVLEREYLHRVERAHGLPVGARQVGASSRGRVYRDVGYGELGLVVELDGRVDHTAVDDRDRDLDRDLDAAVDGQLTVRLGWGQALGRACRTAARLAALMQRLGWTGELVRCPECPAEERWRYFRATR